jgi:hypothetical protein
VGKVVSDELSADFEEVFLVQMARSGFCRLILSIKWFTFNFFSRDGRMRECLLFLYFEINFKEIPQDYLMILFPSINN